MSPSVGAKSTVRPRWSFTAPSSTLAPESLAAQIARVLGIEPQPAPLSAQERGLAEALNRDKYVRREWAFRRQPALTTVLSTKARSGVVTLEARMEGNIIAEAQVRGDFLLPNQGEMERVLKRMAQQPSEAARLVVEASALPEDIKERLETFPFCDFGPL
jgi:hypothetical protein